MPRAPLQQNVGEPAGRRPDIQRESTGDIDVKLVERMGELDSSATDPWVLWFLDMDGRIDWNCRACLERTMAVDLDLASENQRASLLARVDEPARNQQRIEADAPSHRPESRERTSRLPLDDPSGDAGKM
jgi:hypothetical protein